MTSKTVLPVGACRSPEGAWLDPLHQRLDAAVAAAYGWPADIAMDDALARLLALNHARKPASA